MSYLFDPAIDCPPVYAREVSVSLEAFIALFGHPPAAPQLK